MSNRSSDDHGLRREAPAPHMLTNYSRIFLNQIRTKKNPHMHLGSFIVMHVYDSFMRWINDGQESSNYKMGDQNSHLFDVRFVGEMCYAK